MFSRTSFLLRTSNPTNIVTNRLPVSIFIELQCEIFLQLLRHRLQALDVRLVDTVVDPQSFLPASDKTSILEHPQVMRHGGIRQAGILNQVADAYLPGLFVFRAAFRAVSYTHLR